MSLNKTFETRMKKEVELLQKLQNHPEVKDIITIYYMPRMGSEKWVPITTPVPQNSLYPVKFKVRYKMPMYVCPKGKLKKNWQGTIHFEVNERALLGNDDLGIGIEGGSFPADSIPFNKHVNQGWVCTGSIWRSAVKPKQGSFGGIWRFVVAIGEIFNLDEFGQAPTGDHLNGEARVFYENVRHKQPTNIIKWPTDLSINNFTIKAATTAKPKFTIKPLK